MVNASYTNIVAKCSVFIIVWLLLSLQTVFYVYNPPLPNEPRSTSTGCANYTKSACLEVLNQTKKNCLSCELTNESYIAISASTDQEANEKTAQVIKTGLSLLGASQTCVSSLIPFMCLYLFPLCGANATVTKQQCIEISTVLCKDEWQRALNIQAIKDQVPKCESLPSITGKETVSLFNYNSETTNAIQVNCSDQFVLRNGTCQPLCDKLKLFSNQISDIAFVFEVLAAFAGEIFGALLFISCCIWRKKMFVFPLIVILYMSITTVTLATFALISSLLDRKTLFCSSQYLTEALKTPTAYCSLTGSVFVYGIIQLEILGLCHASVVFVKLQFPLHSRGLEGSKTIHLIVVLLAVLVPCIPVIAAFATGGYSTAIYPQVVCIIKNPDAAYYSFALMQAIITGINVPLLIISFMIVIKHNFIRRRSSNVENPLSFTEIKLLALRCYFISLATVLQATFTIIARNHDRFYEVFLNYFACESSGTSPKCNVAKEALDTLTLPGVWVTLQIFLGTFPAVYLVYVVNFRDIKQKCLFFVKETVHCIEKTDTQHDISA